MTDKNPTDAEVFEKALQLEQLLEKVRAVKHDLQLLKLEDKEKAQVETMMQFLGAKQPVESEVEKRCQEVVKLYREVFLP